MYTSYLPPYSANEASLTETKIIDTVALTVTLILNKNIGRFGCHQGHSYVTDTSCLLFVAITTSRNKVYKLVTSIFVQVSQSYAF